MDKDIKTEDIKGFLLNFAGSIKDDNMVLYKRIIESSEIKSFGDFEEYYFSVIYPFDNFLDSFVMSEISENDDVIFIMNHSQFIECHFKKIIVKKEGSSCCADKSRTIIRDLIEFFKNGKKIYFNYNGKYTFHLPTSVFTDHDKIVSFYDGLKDLYYGSPEKYLKALGDVYAPKVKESAEK